VGSLSALDADGNALTYTLTDNASGRFMLDATGTKLLVADGFRLDFEQAISHNVTVQVSDGKGGSATQIFSIAVADVYQEVTFGSVANDVFYSGKANDWLRGNIGNDRLFGGAGNDVLKGDVGNDVIGGGAGKDKLYGYKGKFSRDAFVFDTKITSKFVASKNADTIYDFGSKYDSLYLDDAAFSNNTLKKYFKGKNASVDKPLKFKSGFFKVGTKATDKDDFIIYDKAKHKLYWDADGSGSKAMLEIATLKLQKGEGTTLTYKDFFFI
jgi:Ca2+-binding RTX toxin-like protein